MTGAYILDAVRTPFGRYGGALAGVRPDDLVSYAVSRRQFGRAIAALQLVQAMIADSKADLVADRNVQVHGGAGYGADHAAERHYRDARLARLYEGTTQIQQLVITRSVIRAARAAGT